MGIISIHIVPVRLYLLLYYNYSTGSSKECSPVILLALYYQGVKLAFQYIIT